MYGQKGQYPYNVERADTDAPASKDRDTDNHYALDGLGWQDEKRPNVVNAGRFAPTKTLPLVLVSTVRDCNILLDQHPDFRPVFEDPSLVRTNFELVYRKAGGVLPEDKPNNLRLILKRIVNHSLFKVFRFFPLIKKLYCGTLGQWELWSSLANRKSTARGSLPNHNATENCDQIAPDESGTCTLRAFLCRATFQSTLRIQAQSDTFTHGYANKKHHGSK
jgi:hypothetical protein